MLASQAENGEPLGRDKCLVVLCGPGRKWSKSIFVVRNQGTNSIAEGPGRTPEYDRSPSQQGDPAHQEEIFGHHNCPEVGTWSPTSAIDMVN